MRKQRGQTSSTRPFRFINLGRSNLYIDVVLQRQVDRILKCEPLGDLLRIRDYYKRY